MLAIDVFIFVIFVILQQNFQEQLEANKREVKTLRAELEQLHPDRPYYVAGSGVTDVDDKVDEDPLRRQQRGRDWAAAEDPSKVSLLGTTVRQISELFCR